MTVSAFDAAALERLIRLDAAQGAGSDIAASFDAFLEGLDVAGLRDQGVLERLVDASRARGRGDIVPAAYKAMGLTALERQDYGAAIEFLESSVKEGNAVGSRPDPRSRACLAFWHDVEIDRAYETIGRTMHGPTLRRERRPRPRFAVLTSSLQVESSTTAMVERIALALQARGADVVVISTEVAPSGDSPALARLAAGNVEVLAVPVELSKIERLRYIFSYLEGSPVDAAFWFVWPLDAVAKIASVTRIAPRQVFLNNTCEHGCGDFDVLLFAVSPRELECTNMRGERRFVPDFIAARDKVERAAPFERARFGFERDHVVLGTYGRLSKCVDPRYVATMARILRAAPNARLLLLGPGDSQSEPYLRAAFSDEGVGDRVVFGGNYPETYHGIYKMTDVYCDTLFWRGGQSILEAMVAGVPVVAMRARPDPILDPTGAGPMSATADMLGPDVDVAPPDDDAAYEAIALRYIRDPEARRSAGAVLQTYARLYDEPAHMDAIFAALAET